MVVHYSYCPLCGQKLGLRSAGDDGMVPYCESCGQMWFDSFSSCVIVLTFNSRHEVLMTLQPHLTLQHWVFTSGFITPGESAEQAAAREVKEELGINLERVESAGTYWFARGGMLMHAFLGYTSSDDFTLSEEVREAEWCDVWRAAEKMGPVRPRVADYFMMKEFVTRYQLCDWRTLWPGQEIT